MLVTNVFDDVRITRKLTTLFSVVILGIVVLSITFWYEARVGSRSAERSSIFAEYEGLVVRTQTNYLKARRYESDFLISSSASTGQTYNAAPLENYNKHMQELEKAMEGLFKIAPIIDKYTQVVETDLVNADTEDYVQSMVQQVSTVSKNYKRSFNDIVNSKKTIGLTESNGLRKRANDHARVIESGISDLKNPLVFGLLQSIRENEKHILQSTDLTQAFEELKVDAKNLHSQVQVSRLKTATKLTVLANLDEYLRVLTSIVSSKRLANEYTELYDFMLGPLFDEMQQSAEKRAQLNSELRLAEFSFVKSLFTFTVLGVAVAVLVMLFLFGRSLAKPIQTLSQTIHQVNSGNTEARSSVIRNDELGDLSKAFDKLLDERVTQLAIKEKENDRLNESIVELLKSVARLSKKDFTVKVPVSEDVTGAVGDSLNLLANETGEALRDVRNISIKVAKVSSHVKTQSNYVREETRRERKQAETAMDELNLASNAMQKISKDAQKANQQADNALNNTQVALDTVNESVQGINSIRDTISETEKRIKRLGERSQEITGVVNLINSIAERTHILALNASMHAASAGEAGRGFAVVADEVQRLAENAREATKEIATLVSNIQTETSDTVFAMNNAITHVAKGTELAERAGEAMSMTQVSTKELVDSVDVIAQSSRSQAKSSAALVNRAKEIVESTRETDSNMKQQAANTELLGKYSKNLVKTVSVFKLPSSQLVEQDEHDEIMPVEELEQELDFDVAAEG